MATTPASLTLTPEDAVAYFRAKGEAIAWDYTDVWRDANVRAFTVAKATSLDVLRTIRAEVDKSIGDGQTFEAFKRALRPRLQDLGWWGSAEALDAETGELQRVQLGSNRRLRTIYQTNVQTSYMAGRFKRMLGTVEDRPYWRYVAVMDGRTRPLHRELNGKVWRWDDPIWQVIWPPNGWGCRCRVVALTEREFQALGVPLQDGSNAVVQLQVPVGRDGNTVAVQGVRFRDDAGRDRVFRPDPGWDYNPGQAWAEFDQAAFARRPAVQLLPGQATASSLAEPALVPAQPAQLPLANAVLAGLDVEQARAHVRSALLQGLPQRVLLTPLGDVPLRPELLPAVPAGIAPDWVRWSALVPAVLEQPGEVWLQAWSDGSYRTRHLRAFNVLGQALVLAVREGRDGSLAWEALDPALAEMLRTGTLLFGGGR